jgi:hypothetical protein
MSFRGHRALIVPATGTRPGRITRIGAAPVRPTF